MNSTNRLIDLAANLLKLSRKFASEGETEKSREFEEKYSGVLMAIEYTTNLTEYRAVCIINDMLR